MNDPPTTPARLPATDVLRGVAILGILLMNVTSFAMPFDAYNDPRAFGDDSGANAVVFRAEQIFVAGKFLALLSMLFGAGIVLRAVPRAGFHVRRMIVLGVIGLLHAYLLWYGDILFAYAVVGLIVFPLRRLGARSLLAIGAAFIVLTVALNALWTLPFLAMPSEERVVAFAPDAAAIAHEIVVTRGGYFDLLPLRFDQAVAAQTVGLLVYTLPSVAGLMLIGMGLTKLGLLTGRCRAQTFVATALLCCVVGLSLATVMSRLADRSPDDAFVRLGLCTIADPLIAAITAVGYAAIVVPLATRWPLAPLAALGRCALSAYLLQTLICTTIFYGHGFGLFASVDRVHQLIVVGSVWAFESIAATVWLRYFRAGPAEWIWRRLAQ